MNTEMAIALVGVGGALGGAIIGGAAAVVSAGIQGKRTAAAATKAYESALEVSLRAAQREAYVHLVRAANDYEGATEELLDPAMWLIHCVNCEQVPEPYPVTEEKRSSYRTQVAQRPTTTAISGAARSVALYGPSTVKELAKGVLLAARDLDTVFEKLEETVQDQATGHWHAELRENQPHQTHDALHNAIADFVVAVGTSDDHEPAGTT